MRIRVSLSRLSRFSVSLFAKNPVLLLPRTGKVFLQLVLLFSFLLGVSGLAGRDPGVLAVFLLEGFSDAEAESLASALFSRFGEFLALGVFFYSAFLLIGSFFDAVELGLLRDVLRSREPSFGTGVVYTFVLLFANIAAGFVRFLFLAFCGGSFLVALVCFGAVLGVEGVFAAMLVVAGLFFSILGMVFFVLYLLSVLFLFFVGQGVVFSDAGVLGSLRASYGFVNRDFFSSLWVVLFVQAVVYVFSFFLAFSTDLLFLPFSAFFSSFFLVFVLSLLRSLFAVPVELWGVCASSGFYVGKGV